MVRLLPVNGKLGERLDVRDDEGTGGRSQRENSEGSHDGCSMNRAVCGGGGRRTREKDQERELVNAQSPGETKLQLQFLSGRYARYLDDLT